MSRLLGQVTSAASVSAIAEPAAAVSALSGEYSAAWKSLSESSGYVQNHSLPANALVYSPKSQSALSEADFCALFESGKPESKYRQDRHRAEYFLPSGFQVFKDTLRIFRDPKSFDKPSTTAGNRKKIFQFSPCSQRALRFKSLNSEIPLISQFCATYHDKWPTDGREIKSHLNNFLTVIRQNFPGVNYLWVLEFQTRKTPHFHIFFDFEATEQTRLLIGRFWNQIADPSNNTHLWWHTKRVEKRKNRELSALIPWDMGAGSYLCKYLDKHQQKNVPEKFINVGRFWGSSRGLVNKPRGFVSKEMQAALDPIYLKVSNITRILGKWHESKLRNIRADIRASGRKPYRVKSRVRNSSKSVMLFGGSKVFKQLMHGLFSPKLDGFSRYLTVEKSLFNVGSLALPLSLRMGTPPDIPGVFPPF